MKNIRLTFMRRLSRQKNISSDEWKFLRFVISAAARTGSLLNLAELARDVGISQPTAERWLSVLVASNIVYLLQPYFSKIISNKLSVKYIYGEETKERLKYSLDPFRETIRL